MLQAHLLPAEASKPMLQAQMLPAEASKPMLQAQMLPAEASKPLILRLSGALICDSTHIPEPCEAYRDSHEGPFTQLRAPRIHVLHALAIIFLLLDACTPY